MVVTSLLFLFKAVTEGRKIRLQYISLFQLPSSEERWLTIAKDVYKRCNLLRYLRAINGQHVLLHSPVNIKTTFYSYSGTLIRLGVLSAGYSFTFDH